MNSLPWRTFGRVCGWRRRANTGATNPTATCGWVDRCADYPPGLGPLNEKTAAELQLDDGQGNHLTAGATPNHIDDGTIPWVVAGGSQKCCGGSSVNARPVINDLIRDDAQRLDLRVVDNRAIWLASISTATSWPHPDWSTIEWDALPIDPRSRLGTRVAVKDGCDPSPTPKEQTKQLAAGRETPRWRTGHNRPESRTQAGVATPAHTLVLAARGHHDRPGQPLNGTERVWWPMR